MTNTLAQLLRTQRHAKVRPRKIHSAARKQVGHVNRRLVEGVREYRANSMWDQPPCMREVSYHFTKGFRDRRV